MNCNELRNQLLDAPDQSDPEQDRHLAQCLACTTFQQQLLESCQLFRELPAPALSADFTQAVMQQASLAARKRRRSTQRTFSIAAVLLAAIGVGLVLRSPWLQSGSQSDPQLTDAQRAAIVDNLMTTGFRPLGGIDCGLPGGRCRLASPQKDANLDQREG